MVTPITGPFSKLEYLNGPPTDAGFKPRWYEMSRTWYRQKHPYDLPLSYSFYVRRVHSFTSVLRDGRSDTNDWTSSDDMPTSWPADQNLYNRVYAKMKDKIGESAAVGVAPAAAHQSMSMITNRLMQIARFTSALSRGHIGEAAGHLGVPVKGKLKNLASRASLRRNSKALANHFLEFHFGWQPLLQDIHDSAEALSSPILPHEVKVTARLRLKPKDHVLYPWNSGSRTESWVDESIEQVIRLQCGVSVLNPNLALAQQLGLVNPATIVWEKVPFSFVLDWFVNVGDFLSSFTDFAGLQLSNQQRTIFTRYARSSTKVTTYVPSDGYSYTTTSSVSSQKSSVMLERILGPFPGPELIVRRWKSPSPVRGLTAVSLLLQRLRKP